MDLFNLIRKSERKTPPAKAIFHTIVISGIGLIAGVMIKQLDLYTTNLANVFSQISVWIFLCTIIAVYSSTAKRAAVNVFGFCMGMLLAYYITAEITASVYSHSIAYGWTIFALFCLPMGYCVWYAKGKGSISKIISVGIIIVMLVTSSVLFDKIRVSDMLFTVLTGFLLFKR